MSAPATRPPAVPDPLNNDQPTRPRYEYAYDANGAQTLIRDPLGHETRFTYDEDGRQLTRTLPLGFGSDGIASVSELSTLDSQPLTTFGTGFHPELTGPLEMTNDQCRMPRDQ